MEVANRFGTLQFEIGIFEHDSGTWTGGICREQLRDGLRDGGCGSDLAEDWSIIECVECEAVVGCLGDGNFLVVKYVSGGTGFGEERAGEEIWDDDVAVCEEKVDVGGRERTRRVELGGWRTDELFAADRGGSGGCGRRARALSGARKGRALGKERDNEGHGNAVERGRDQAKVWQG